MTVFESIPFNDIDKFAEWLDKYGVQDFAPWDYWFDKKYCRQCGGVHFEGKEYGWCELNDNKCKFFPNLDEFPYGKQVVKLWLESEAENTDLMEEDDE